jgi:hypothetical protein
MDYSITLFFTDCTLLTIQTIAAATGVIHTQSYVQLAKKFQVVQQPGPVVLRIQVAMTDV